MTPEERLRARLEALNRGPLPVSAPPAITGNRQTPKTKSSRFARPKTRRLAPPGSAAAIVKPIPGLLRRGEVVANDLGEHLRIALSVDEVWPRSERLVALRHQTLQSARQTKASPSGAPSLDVGLEALLAAFPDHTLLLDLETCGLAGSALFLVGLLRMIDDRLTVELLLARDYGEERAVLASLWRRVQPDTVLATFNGKSFDWPMVLDRSSRHLLFRGRRPPTPAHVDLLHAARRKWKGRFRDCKLQTLEQHVCGRRREGDIPGARIPAAYQEFVRTGFTRDIDAVLFHNAVDLVTLLDLAMRLAGAEA